MYNINCLNLKKYNHLLIYIFVVKKAMPISRAVNSDVFQNYTVFACEMMTLDFDA